MQQSGRYAAFRQEQYCSEVQERTCGCQTDDSAEQAQQRSLQEKCPPNITRLCAERQQNADLPCFLVRGSQHASHNADERDKQCYRTDDGKQADSHFGQLLYGLHRARHILYMHAAHLLSIGQVLFNLELTEDRSACAMHCTNT